MLPDKIIKLADKKRLTIVGNNDDFSRIYDALAAGNRRAADAFRDAVWHKDGKWHGVGIGNIPPNEVIRYAQELDRLTDDQIPLCKYACMEEK